MDKDILRAAGNMTRKKLTGMFKAICEKHRLVGQVQDSLIWTAKKEDHEPGYDGLDPWEHYPEETPSHMSGF